VFVHIVASLDSRIRIDRSNHHHLSNLFTSNAFLVCVLFYVIDKSDCSGQEELIKKFGPHGVHTNTTHKYPSFFTFCF
jgi:hypothetical protein